MIAVLGVLAWLAGTLRWLARYPGIPAAPAERLSLRTARVGLGALDVGIALGVAEVFLLCPPLLELVAELGCALPGPTDALLDLYWGLSGWRALWLAPLLGGLRAAHRPLLDRFGWRRGGWLLLVGVPLGLAAAVWAPLAASLPLLSMAAQ